AARPRTRYRGRYSGPLPFRRAQRQGNPTAAENGIQAAEEPQGWYSRLVARRRSVRSPVLMPRKRRFSPTDIDSLIPQVEKVFDHIETCRLRAATLAAQNEPVLSAA